MDEQYFRDLLSAYIDNELTPEERAMIEDHLRDNPESRRLLEKLRQVDRLVDEHSQLGGDEYWERSARAIEERLGIADTEITDVKKITRVRSGMTWKLVGSIAAIIVLAFIGLHQSDILDEATDSVGIDKTMSRDSAGNKGVYREIEGDSDIGRSVDETDIEQRDRAVDGARELQESIGPESGQSRNESTDLPGNISSGYVSPSGESPSESPVPPVQYSAPAPAPSVEPGEPSQVEEEVATPESSENVPKSAVDRSASKFQRQSSGAGETATGDADSNYKAEAQTRITTRSDHPATATVQPTEDSRLFDAEGAEQLMAEELTRWQSTRDSLIAMMGTGEYAAAESAEKDSSPSRAPGVDLRPQSSGFVKKSGEDDSLSKARDEKSKVSPSRYRPHLLEAWYNVCRLTSDSTERANGMKYLRTEALRKGSPQARLAQSYLDKLTQ